MQAELTQTAIRDVEKTAADHWAWLKQLHCALLFGKAPGPAPQPLPDSLTVWAEGRIYDKSVPPCERREALRSLRHHYERLRRAAAELAEQAASGEAVGCEDYMRFMGEAERYAAELRRFDAFLHQSLAETDPLTGVNNRQGMMRALRREWTRVERTRQPCCLALVDLDHFKMVNDTYGHVVGDRVLSAAARFFLRRLRPYDRVYRFGGEEFLFCLPNTDLAKAQRVLERLRNLMARVPVRLEDGRRVTVTASIGLTEMTPDAGTLEECILAADAAVYAAKKAGRNRVVLSSDLTAQPLDQLAAARQDERIAKCGSEDPHWERPWAVRRAVNGAEAPERLLAPAERDQRASARRA